MIKSFIFENFKSFEKARLDLESITSLIGTNSSGKSNAIEGISILAEVATGLDLGVILDGTRNNESQVRGGSKACSRFKTNSFKLGCLIDLDENYDLLYEIRIGTAKRIMIEEESLYKVANGRINHQGEKIFKTKGRVEESGDIKVEYRNGKRGTNPDVMCIRTSAVLPQLLGKLPNLIYAHEDNLRYIKLVLDNLKNIFVLDPIPSEMRDYVRMTDTELKTNCENISAVLYHMCNDVVKKEKLMQIVCNLPENEVLDIEFVETKLGDVIFGLKERYMSSSELVDAKKLSDGTLRCIAIITAVLTMPPNGVLVIEEIDNGIHPGRVRELINSLVKLSKERKIDILLTTHNASLLNQYDKEQLMGVTIVYRDREKGTSKLVSFVDLKQYPDILIEGGVGSAMLNDTLTAVVKAPPKDVDYSWMGV
ncbi:ATP-binding protein [Blautia schinkii]|nr:ATP-binding protein [Blautia schinkii]